MEIVLIIVGVFVLLLIFGGIDNNRPVTSWSDDKLLRMHGKLLHAARTAQDAGNMQQAKERTEKAHEVESEIRRRAESRVSTKAKIESEKKEPDLEALALAMVHIGWNSEIGENEKIAVSQAGINLNVYNGAITFLSVFAALYAFSIWSKEKSLTEEQTKSVINLFWDLVFQECQAHPMPEKLFEKIQKSVPVLHAAQLRDEEAAQSGTLSFELPRAFLQSIPGCKNEPPLELMPGTSSRFHGTIEVAENVFNKLWNESL